MNRLITVAFSVAILLLLGCKSENPGPSVLEEVFPPLKISNAALFRINHSAITPVFFKEQWTWVAFARGGCDEDCTQKLQQLNAADGGQKLLFFEGPADNKRLNALAGQFPQVAIATATTAASAENFSRQFDADFIDAAQKVQYVYLVNPDVEVQYVIAAQHVNSKTLAAEIGRLRNE